MSEESDEKHPRQGESIRTYQAGGKDDKVGRKGGGGSLSRGVGKTCCRDTPKNAEGPPPRLGKGGVGEGGKKILPRSKGQATGQGATSSARDPAP